MARIARTFDALKEAIIKGERPKTNGWQGNANGKIGTNKHNPLDAKNHRWGHQ